jgi:hypothetical protein
VQLSTHRAAALASLHIPREVYAGYCLALYTAFATINIVVGIVIFRRRPGDRGALLMAMFLIALGVLLPDVIDWQSSQGGVWTLLTGALGVFFGSLMVTFFFLFPDGRFVPAWTRWFLAAGVYWQCASTFFPQTILNPERWRQPLPAMLFLILLASVLFAQVYRYRYISSRVQRQQTKLVVFGATGALLTFIVLVVLAGAVLHAAARDDLIWTWVGVTVLHLVWLAVPISVGVAILRYRLYDIDVLINRALVYGSLTLSIAAIYAGIVLGLQFLVRVVSGHHSDLTIAVATLAVAGLFNPWRRRIQHFIDQRFYRRKYDAARTLAVFSSRLRDEVDLDRLSYDLISVVHETVEPARVSIWLAESGERG